MAHRMLIAAGPDNAELSEAVYRAYFIEGRDIGRIDELTVIAEEHGRPDLVEAMLDDATAKQLETHLATGNRMRLDGVPFFIFFRKIRRRRRPSSRTSDPRHRRGGGNRRQTASASSSWTICLQTARPSSTFAIGC